MHPYDDPDVIAGQGTIGMEILRQHARPIHAVFVPVGGGGLIAGIAAYVKALRPEIKVIGVEPVDADAMARSLKAGRRVVLDHVGLFADGVAVKQVGEETFRLCRELVDEMVLVDTDEICAAIKDVFEDTRAILEPAGALAIAGAKAWVAKRGAKGKTLVAIACGANMNFDRLRFVAERAEVGEAARGGARGDDPGAPGQLQALLRAARARATSPSSTTASPVRRRRMCSSASRCTRPRRNGEASCANCNAARLQTLDLSDNEMAKLHVRHMVGGRAPLARRRAALPLRVPRAAGRADEVPRPA